MSAPIRPDPRKKKKRTGEPLTEGQLTDSTNKYFRIRFKENLKDSRPSPRKEALFKKEMSFQDRLSRKQGLIEPADATAADPLKGKYQPGNAPMQKRMALREGVKNVNRNVFGRPSPSAKEESDDVIGKLKKKKPNSYTVSVRKSAS